MIRKIYCGASSCAHNRQGECLSGVIDVDTYVGNTFNAPFCNTYAHLNSLGDIASEGQTTSSISMHNYADALNLSQANTEFYSNAIGCSATECRFNNNCACSKNFVHISEPGFSDGGTLCFCESYER